MSYCREEFELHTNDGEQKTVCLPPCPLCAGLLEVMHIGNSRTKKQSIRVKCKACRIERTDANLGGGVDRLIEAQEKAWQASRQDFEGEPVNGSRIEEVCVQALIDISSCAWGIEGYDTSEDAANWMWNNANTALAEMWDSDLSALNSEKIQSPVGYTNWAQLSYVKSDGQGSFYPDTADDCFIPLYTHPASRQALSSCSEIPNSSDPDSRQALEGEAVAEITEGHVLQWRPPYNRPPVGTKLYAQPPTKADEQAHKRVHEYDGAHKCLDCGAQWGALPGHPKEPEHCAALAQPVSVPDGRSNEWLKTLDRWIDLMDRLEGEPINTSVQREIYRVKTEVMRYRKHKVAPKQEQDDE